MRAIIVLVIMTLIWVMNPTFANAKDRDRHDRNYERERDHYVYKVDRDHDRRHEVRHGKAWKKQHRHNKYWKKHRKHRHVAYRPAPSRVIYKPFMGPIIVREPVAYYPASYLTIGAPNVRFHVSW